MAVMMTMMVMMMIHVNGLVYDNRESVGDVILYSLFDLLHHI